ncbi:hypothetical protein TCAL_11106 [Tigriopus californicus]|uniref:Nonsense-mediated mRNA decay factor SMG8 n=1 Tax=Tigriopus californicus TaxID=6832 RepID=A0A553PDI9_TIGCA|nr:nonsense-mediated mRNA decay factor SMG8-like [Tigriopus californicus]TRY75744.1 hypothetical protein TCAL_11106 [Tigriopus californicus]|eukprot:TCALIF_11106-PA protein Name:"Similar to smg8 Protein smg8 (Xenopus tropicalis)" AED:0.07 eAED:0.07 QI:145/1/0.93/1/0.8/0.87/16/311/934
MTLTENCSAFLPKKTCLGYRISDHQGHFTLPLDRDFSRSAFIQSLAPGGFTVVGVVGKGGERPGKGIRIFDTLTQRAIFRLSHHRHTQPDAPSSACIRGFVDRRCQRVYLDLEGIQDMKALVAAAQHAEDVLQTQGFHAFLSERSLEGSKLMLLMFQICHLIILYHPNHTIDLSYVQLFQSIESVRTKLQSSFSDALKSIPNLNKNWYVYGRQSPPRILFFFGTAPVDLRGSRGTAGILKKDGTISKHPPIRKLEFSLEDQIYRIFRKARLITNSSNNLFNVPGRDGFVYVDNGTDASFGDESLDSINALQNLLDQPLEIPEVRGPFKPYFYEEKVQESRSSRCFSQFLDNHLQSIPTKGTDAEGNLGGLELPSIHVWLATVEASLQMFQPDSGFQIRGKSSEISERASLALLSYNDRDIRFSEQRCSKAHPLAFNAYKEGLPQYFTQDFHNAKLMQAMSIFSVQARGPSTSKYAEKLAEDCRAFWENGRQMCEEYSLTGNPCKQRLHYIHGQEPSEPPMETSDEQKAKVDDDSGWKRRRSTNKKTLPTIHHESGLTFVSACNCGKRQSNRSDPFELIEANWRFFSECEIECCQALVHLDFPVCEAKANAIRTSAALSSSALLDLASDPNAVKTLENLEIKDSDETSTTKGKPDLPSTSVPPFQSLADLAQTNQGNRPGVNFADPISFMLTKTTPTDRLPLFPSWSLIQLGSSHLYSHSSGMNQPGFLQGSKSLLPWDVPLKKLEWKTVKEQWPNLAENAMKKLNFNPNAIGTAMGMTVKVFLGFEYECPRGHRFMASAPGQALKSNPSGLREAAGKVLASDMPLFMTCPGRIGVCLPAQLMRIHVVTPKAPIHVTLMPEVQPAEDGPVFHCGWKEPKKLPHNSCWVLRLPFIYCGENGAHLPPQKEVTPQNAGRILKGVINVSEDFEDFNRGK